MNYSPENLNQTPIKTLRLSFHVFLNDNGTGNFQNNTTDRQYLNNIVSFCNTCLSNLGLLNYGSSIYIVDSRIRLKLENIYFHYHTVDVNYSDPQSVFTKYVINDFDNLGLTDDVKYYTQHILLGNPYNILGGRASGIGTKGWINEVGWYKYYNDNGIWNYVYPSKNLIHEMGHSIGLFHNFHGGVSGNQCDNCTDNDMDDGNCPIESTSTNFMDYHPMGWASENPGLSNCQLSIAHFLLSGRSNISDIVYTDYCVFDNSNIIRIDENTEWECEKKINSNIIIDSGATLTIKCKISLSSNSKIIIERGGKLIINGGVLKSSSIDKRWKGIEIWGTSNKSQYILDLPYQGQLEIINGGKIENAEVAIFVGKVNAQGLNESGYEGGLVNTNGAFITNCKTGVVFNPYHNYNPANPSILRSNLSSFKNCTFETNSSWIVVSNVYPDAFVKLTEVEGIYFRGCAFVNNVPDNFVVYRRGKGIVATDAYFYVDQYCPSTYPCTSPVNTTFSNLYYAIDASKTWWDDVLSIKYATFNSNYRGIYISSILNPIVMNNTFNIPDYDHSIDVILPTNNQPYGLYLNQSTGYTVENNSFNSSTTNKSTKHGVIVNYSGSANNRIYNNTFTSLGVGSVAQGQNRGTNTGLVYKCNEFTNCTRDISIAPYSMFYGNVALYQGSLTEPAANLFSLAGTSFSDIYNESWTVNYYHNTKPARTARWVPMNYSTTSITLFNTSVAYNKTAQCPVSGEGMNKNLNNSYSNINNYSSEINIIENQLSNLVDGGNTMLLIDEITNSPSWDALNLRNNLLNKSPFLSDTVLISAVENESVLPPIMLTQVLTANPQGIKSEEVKESIENRQNVIPDYLITEIENSRNYGSV